MVLSFTQVLAIVVVSATLLLAVAFVTIRSAKNVYPVFCPHCWVHEDKKTVVTFSEEKSKWAICPDCTKWYWTS
jgi:hypothetical protein